MSFLLWFLKNIPIYLFTFNFIFFLLMHIEAPFSISISILSYPSFYYLSIYLLINQSINLFIHLLSIYHLIYLYCFIPLYFPSPLHISLPLTFFLFASPFITIHHFDLSLSPPPSPCPTNF